MDSPDVFLDGPLDAPADAPVDAQNTGWLYRGIFDDPRLTEIVSLYENLGFMVRMTPFFVEKGCDRCFKDTPKKFKALYTKKIDSC